MYRMTLFLPTAQVGTDDQAMEVCDQVATLCDQLLGRPSSGESKLTYILTSEVDEDGEDALDRWIRENLDHPRVRGVIIPSPISEKLN